MRQISTFLKHFINQKFYQSSQKKIHSNQSLNFSKYLFTIKTDLFKTKTIYIIDIFIYRNNSYAHHIFFCSFLNLKLKEKYNKTFFDSTIIANDWQK